MIFPENRFALFRIMLLLPIADTSIDFEMIGLQGCSHRGNGLVRS